MSDYKSSFTPLSKRAERRLSKADRRSLPLTVNSKVNYNALANEPLNGSEVAVCIEETNISVGKISMK